MRYVVIADHIAHGAADLLDLATHPDEVKHKVAEVINALKNAPALDEISKK